MPDYHRSRVARCTHPKFHSLQSQLVLSILLAVVLAAAIAGIPTLWLIHQQVDRQAWAQVDGGLQAARPTGLGY